MLALLPLRASNPRRACATFVPMLNDLSRVAPPVDGRQSERALAVQRGVGRLLRARGFAVVAELPLATGRRADVVGLGPAGDLWIVEIKSSVEDFRTDHKWPDYRLSCDRLFFATHADVPLDIFPEDAGMILADGYGAELLREAPEHRLVAATRKAMLVRFAQAAAHRLHGLVDPEAARLAF
ncbi:hypothetical protein SAMN02982931_04515 [Bauldia litoralis]|uniref:DNA repair protein MmcB-related protein n=2 Tax=Bauldia litoralis TaxID=665467 RepID=A0A1G6EH38_9HYPH|nr:hypothetical protein SAMN02982931_04515 [Bauldia litoralis]